MKPAPMTSTRRGLAANAACRRAASLLVRSVYTPSSAASAGFGHGRERTPVAISSRSNGISSPFARCTTLFARSKRVAATPSCQSASIARNRGSLVWLAGTQPLSTCFERGGRSYGSSGSSPMMVKGPLKSALRNASAPRSPANEAPTMTIRPRVFSASRTVCTSRDLSSEWDQSWLLWLAVIQPIYDNRLDWTEAAARRTRRRGESSGLGLYISASSPLSWSTSGARGTHCAYPWQRFRSTTIRIGLSLLHRLARSLRS
jgi:hypothetical protein